VLRCESNSSVAFCRSASSRVDSRSTPQVRSKHASRFERPARIHVQQPRLRRDMIAARRGAASPLDSDAGIAANPRHPPPIRLERSASPNPPFQCRYSKAGVERGLDFLNGNQVGSAICQFQLRKLCGLHTTVFALKFDLHPIPQKLAGPPIRLKSVNRITAPTFFTVSI
jgi:hypothetical protein